MALTVTHKSRGIRNLGTLGENAVLFHDDVTEYAANGFLPGGSQANAWLPAAAANVGIITLWQENADFELRWDATNGKVKIFVMSTGAEAGAVDAGEFKYLLVDMSK